MIVTIDGPAGAGKSTLARRLADRLGFRFLDTGAMYRAVAWYFREQGISADAGGDLSEALAGLYIGFDGSRVLVNGRDVSGEIRSAEVSELASVIAVLPAVRAFLVIRQRELGQSGCLVTEGRDQGTVVFPDAACKFYLTASPGVRARRRWEELRQSQPDLTLDQIVADQERRDHRDANRKVGRLQRAPDAIVIQSDERTLEKLVDEMEAWVRRRAAGGIPAAAPDHTGKTEPGGTDG